MAKINTLELDIIIFLSRGFLKNSVSTLTPSWRFNLFDFDTRPPIDR